MASGSTRLSYPLASAENVVGCGMVIIALNANGVAMRVMAIGDTPDRMTEDLDRRLGHVLVVIRGTGLAKVLEFPGLVFSSLDVQLELNTSEVAEFLKSNIGARSAGEGNGLVWDRILSRAEPDNRRAR